MASRFIRRFRRNVRRMSRRLPVPRSRFGTRGHVIRRLARGIHYFKRTCQLTQLSFNNASTNVGAYVFSIGNLPNVTEFSNLFDEYLITGIKIKFIPDITGNDATPIGSVVALPNFYTVIDHDDNTAPSNLDELLQYQTLRMTQGHRIHSRYLKPMVSNAVYKVGLTSGYGSMRAQWCDFSNTDIAHYGLKYCMDPSWNNATALKYQVIATFYFKCRGVR